MRFRCPKLSTPGCNLPQMTGRQSLFPKNAFNCLVWLTQYGGVLGNVKVCSVNGTFKRPLVQTRDSFQALFLKHLPLRCATCYSFSRIKYRWAPPRVDHSCVALYVTFLVVIGERQKTNGRNSKKAKSARVVFCLTFPALENYALINESGVCLREACVKYVREERTE
jgi:hypothetical protein